MDKKVLLVSGLMVLFGGFFVYEKFAVTSQSQTPIINNSQTQISGSNPPPQTVTTPLPQQVVMPTTPKPKTPTLTPQPVSAGLKSGIYTGNTINSMYGPSQVQITVQLGKITDVNFIQYPSERQTSLRKSQMAMAGIKQEVIQSQGADVNTISGATETSSAFIQSIISALSQAS